MKIQKHRLAAILLMGMVMSSIQSTVGASYKDAPKLEPFTLTQDVISKLTQIDTNVTKGSSFRLRGITITSAGSKTENHWYYFSNDTAFDKMIIFIPEKFIDFEIPFFIGKHVGQNVTDQTGNIVYCSKGE
ncbi:MAG: hypothetical protein GY777_05810 [Candidatus Brocadiaceae bacterium]|nr:hypothetical protein [Candidatus Brocadiaceae bacterium]